MSLRLLPPLNRLIALLFVLIGSAAHAVATECTAVYSSTSTNISAFNIQSGALMFSPVINRTEVNAVGLNPNDGKLYWVDQTVRSYTDAYGNLNFYYAWIYRRNADGTGAEDTVGYINLGTNSNAPVIGGTFDASGNYYLMRSNKQVYRVPAATAQAAGGGQLASSATFTINSSSPALSTTTNGDIVFDASGRLWATVQNSSNVALLAQIDLTSGTILSSTPIKNTSGGSLTATTSTGVNGLAIDPVTGRFFISSTISGTVGIYALDASLAPTQLTATAGVDLASCAPLNSVPNSPTLSKQFGTATRFGAPASTSLTITIGNSNLDPYYLYQPLTDTLPANMTIASGATTTTTCTNGTPSTTSTSVSLPAGASIPVGGCTVTISAVTGSAVGTYTNTISSGALITSVGTYSTAATATFEIKPLGPVNLSVTKTDNGVNFNAGATGSYFITVTNGTGASSASTPITLRDVLPAGMTLETITTTAAGSVGTPTVSGQTVDWTYTPSPALAAGDSVTFKVTVKIAASVTGGTTLSNYVAVGGGGDPDPIPTPGAACSSAQCASDSTTITAAKPAYTIDKADADASFTSGSQGTYTLKITNVGTLETTGGINVTELLPTGLTFASASSSSGTVTGGVENTSGTQNLIVTPSSSLQPNQSLTVTLVVNATAASGTLTNRVSVGGGGSADAPDPATCTVTTPPGNCDVESTPISAATATTDLRLTKSVSPTTTAIGSAVTYTITVYNDTTADLSNVGLSDLVPDNVTVSSATCAKPGGNSASACGTVTVNGNLVSMTGAVVARYTVSRQGARTDYPLTITISGVATATGSSTNQVTAVLPNGYKDATPLNNSATAILTVTSATNNPPLACSTQMYGLFGTFMGAGGTTATMSEIRSLTTAGSIGSILTTVPTSATNTAAYGYNYALAISNDGRYVFASGDDKTLRVYDVVAGRWIAFVTYSNPNSERIIRMAVGPNGVGYFGSTDQLWSFSTSSPFTVNGPYTVSFTNTSNITPAPFLQDTQNSTNSGDFIVDADGYLYLLANPNIGGTVQSYVDIFRIVSASTATPTATFFGRISDADLGGRSYAGLASLSSGTYALSNDRLMVQLDLATLQATNPVTTGTSTNISTDLATCYQPVLRPSVTVVKSVRQIDPATGAEITGPVVAGSTLEYTITTRNTGTLNAANVTLRDTVPTGSTYVSGSTRLNGAALTDLVSGTQNSKFPFTTATAINSPGAPNGVLYIDTTGAATSNDFEAVVTFRVTVNTDATTIVNQATVVHADGQTSSNTTSTDRAYPTFTVVKGVNTPIIKVTDTGLDGATDPATFTRSPAQLEYTIRVRNTSSINATNVKVTDLLPVGMTYVAPSVGTPAISEPVITTVVVGADSRQQLMYTIASLPAGGTQELRLTVDPSTPRETAQRPFVNNASASLPGSPTVTSADVRTDVVYVKLVKRVRNVTRGETTFGVQSDGVPGDVLEYCINFYNYSSLALVKFQIKDLIPTNTTALLTGYDAEEPSSTTNFGVKVTRPTTPTYYLSSGNTSDPTVVGASLTGTQMTTNIGTLSLSESGQTCFRVTVQ